MQKDEPPNNLPTVLAVIVAAYIAFGLLAKCGLVGVEPQRREDGVGWEGE